MECNPSPLNYAVPMTDKATRSTFTWAFRARFRRNAYGWKGSKLAISRINEALSEIRAVMRNDPALAAEGAVLLLTILSPALSDIDSSSGVLGNAVNSAIDTLVPIIVQAPVTTAQRQKWLTKLHVALVNEDIPYIESLGEYWGELCADPELASKWADELLPMVRLVIADRVRGAFAYYKGTEPCLSALFHAKRHDELLQLLDSEPRPYYGDVKWGAKVFIARGQIDEGLAYWRKLGGNYIQETKFAKFAEEALLAVGRRSEAFDRYALLANRGNSNLSTFRAIHKKYPEIDPQKLLSLLIDTSPESPGKWFATAKTIGQLEVAEQLIWQSPCDPHTLIRAARDFETKQPLFAMQCARGALHWISTGLGYEITGLDVRTAWQFAISTSDSTGQATETTAFIDRIAESAPWMKPFMGQSVGQ